MTLDGSGSTDPDGSIASYSWNQTIGHLVTLSNSTDPSPTFTVPVVEPLGETLVFNLTVTDNEGGSASDTITVDVAPAKFSDDFTVDTTSSYTVVKQTFSGFPLLEGSFLYDGVGKRVQVLVGDNVGLQFSKGITGSTSGVFALDFLPTTGYPSHGGIWIRLLQDANNYYGIAYFDNTDPNGIDMPLVKKVVNGAAVDSSPISGFYAQGTTYNIQIHFTPTSTIVNAFGNLITLDTNTDSISVSSFEIEVGQQDAYFDNIALY